MDGRIRYFSILWLSCIILLFCNVGPVTANTPEWYNNTETATKAINGYNNGSIEYSYQYKIYNYSVHYDYDYRFTLLDTEGNISTVFRFDLYDETGSPISDQYTWGLYDLNETLFEFSGSIFILVYNYQQIGNYSLVIQEDQRQINSQENPRKLYLGNSKITFSENVNEYYVMLDQTNYNSIMYNLSSNLQFSVFTSIDNNEYQFVNTSYSFLFSISGNSDQYLRLNSSSNAIEIELTIIGQMEVQTTSDTQVSDPPDTTFNEQTLSNSEIEGISSYIGLNWNQLVFWLSLMFFVIGGLYIGIRTYIKNSVRNSKKLPHPFSNFSQVGSINRDIDVTGIIFSSIEQRYNDCSNEAPCLNHQCIICKNKLTLGDAIGSCMECGISAHANEIKTWLKLRQVCPYCRTNW